jgi:hypothetical protein
MENKIMNKELCDCGKISVWCYMPGYSGGGNPYVCDDCVSSPNDVGCSCNWHYSKGEEIDEPEGIENVHWRWVEHPGNEHLIEIKKEEGIWVKLDKKGRPHPCAEYTYDEDGFDTN